MDWVGVILAVLKLVNFLMEYGQQRKWIAVGRDEEIARSMAEILRKTDYAKTALQEATGLSDAAANDFLRGLEPGQPGKGN